MYKRWRFALPLAGLLLFAAETYPVRVNRESHSVYSRYFWWSFIRLDSDPMQRHPRGPTPCETGKANCTRWDLPYMWVDPGWLSELLMWTALPAFVVAAVMVGGLRRLGINEIWGFMISMPLLIFGWYYFVGWLIDRLLFKLRRRV